MQRVGGDDPVAIGYDIFDLVAQVGHRCQETGHTTGVFFEAHTSAPQRRGVLVDEVDGDMSDNLGRVTGGERCEIRATDLSGRHPATAPHTSWAFSYTP